MRIAPIVLFLGCSALACKFAVQSHLIQFGSPAPTEFPALRAALDRLRFAFPHGDLPPVAVPPAASADVTQPPQVPALAKSETLNLIKSAAAKHNVPAAFVQSIVAAESNFNCAAISPKGAIGLMQLMPETAQQFGADPTIPAQNIDAGTRYLKWLMNRYQNRRNAHGAMQRVIAAYNAGPGMVDRYHGIPPFRETRSYVARVLGFFKQFGGSVNAKVFRS
jgi:soluble lytic murein transglycosylase-like protein